jgi:predicted nucleic acid-binding protein
MLKSKENYLFDTVALSNFALAGRFELLVARYGKRAIITPEVLDEVTDGVIAGYFALSEIERAVEEGRLSRSSPLPTAAERQTYRELLRCLGSGEASCIAHAVEHGGVIVTDDGTARQCCNERGIAFTGTIGILKACSMDGALSPEEADKILQSMITAGYYSPVQRISDLG